MWHRHKNIIPKEGVSYTTLQMQKTLRGSPVQTIIIGVGLILIAGIISSLFFLRDEYAQALGQINNRFVAAVEQTGLIQGIAPAATDDEDTSNDAGDAPTSGQDSEVGNGSTAAAEAAHPPADIPYLNGYQYLRGVNVYTVESRRLKEGYTGLGERQASYDYLASHGMKIIRLAVPWQRLQPVPADNDYVKGLNGPIDQQYVAAIREQVNMIGKSGMRAILDLHNGCTYPMFGKDIEANNLDCGKGISVERAENIWLALSSEFKNDPDVAAYNLFNEPRLRIGADVYKQYTQAITTALRNSGDTHALWIDAMGTSDPAGRFAGFAASGPWIKDPLNKIIYSEHFYIDGTSVTNKPYDPTKSYDSFTNLVKAFGDWCTKYNTHCSVGEVGWASAAQQTQWPGSADGWNSIGEKFYALADKYKFDVTYFMAASPGNTGGWLIAYNSDKGHGVIESAQSQSIVIEKHPSR